MTLGFEVVFIGKHLRPLATCQWWAVDQLTLKCEACSTNCIFLIASLQIYKLCLLCALTSQLCEIVHHHISLAYTILQVLRLFSNHENEMLKFGQSFIQVASVTIDMLYTL